MNEQQWTVPNLEKAPAQDTAREYETFRSKVLMSPELETAHWKATMMMMMTMIIMVTMDLAEITCLGEIWAVKR